jgi:hypothetical protein
MTFIISSPRGVGHELTRCQIRNNPMVQWLLLSHEKPCLNFASIDVFG